MSKLLARQDPCLFKTQAIHVEATADGLSYRPVGQPLSFAQMMEKRQPLVIEDPACFEATLANLGVSVRLTLTWHGRDYRLLVRQRRADRQDTVLKPISGYVPAQTLQVPLLTAVQEVAEECLIETEEGWLPGRFEAVWMDTPYHPVLQYHGSHHYRLLPRGGDRRTVYAAEQPLQETPHAYVHLPTSSLQLIYDLHLVLPMELDGISLYHVEQHLENGSLIDRLDEKQPELYLIALNDRRLSGKVFTLQKGQLQAVDTAGIWLSECFTAQRGWLVGAERIGFDDWLTAGAGDVSCG